MRRQFLAVGWLFACLLIGPVSSPADELLGDGQTWADPFPAAKYPEIKVTGFFQADMMWFGQDTLNRETVGNIPDGADFRRARLAATGKVKENVSYMIEMDFGFPGRPSFMDVQMTIHDLPLLGNLRVGQWRQPFGMDELTSVRELTFLERSLPFAFAPFRQIGIGAYDTCFDESTTWALSGFRYPTDFYGGNVGDQGGYALAGRVTHLLWYDESTDRLLHLGGDFFWANPSNNLSRFRSTPEVFVWESSGTFAPPPGLDRVPAFVDTGDIATSDFNVLNAELAASFGRLYMQSELRYATVNRSDGENVAFTSLYAQAAYLLTGETRPYNRANGVFGRIKPLRDFGDCGGWGAWELAGRWSYLDLNDERIRGGQLNDVTLGLNWYLNRYTKFQFNYIHAFLDNDRWGQSDADIAALRAQLDF